MYVYIIIFSFLASFSAYTLSFSVEANAASLLPIKTSYRDYVFYGESNASKNRSNKDLHSKRAKKLFSPQSKNIAEGNSNKKRLHSEVKIIKKNIDISEQHKGFKSIMHLSSTKKLINTQTLAAKKGATISGVDSKTQNISMFKNEDFTRQSVSDKVPNTKKSADVRHNSKIYNNIALVADGMNVKQLGQVTIKQPVSGLVNKGKHLPNNKGINIQNKVVAAQKIVLLKDKGIVKQPDNTLFIQKKNDVLQAKILQDTLLKGEIQNQFISQQLLQNSVLANNTTDALDTEYSINLEFEKSENKIAAFKRLGWVWLIFEGKTKNDLENILKEKFNNAFKIIPSEQYTIFKIRTENVPKITQNLNFYLLNFNDKNDIVQNREVITTTKDDGKFSIPFDELMITLNIMDPDSLEKMKVIPVKKEGNSIRIGYQYPHFKIIPAEFGIVFLNTSDGVNIVNEGNFINVNFPKFVQIRHDDMKALSTPIFKFCEWYFGDHNDFYNVNLRLGSEITNASSEEILEKQLNLVKFYLAHHMSREALGQLQYIKNHHIDSIHNNSFILLYGFALYFSNLFVEAGQMFATVDVSLLNQDQLAELNFWKNLVNIKIGKDSSSLDVYYKTTACSHAYYEDIAITLLNNEVNLGINTKKIGELYDFIRAFNLTSNKINEVLVIFAKFMLYSGNEIKAIEILSKVADNLEDPRVRAEAILEKTKHLVGTHVISVKEAIDILSSLIIIWHGEDLLEGNIVRTLAQNYLADHQYYKSLETLNRINFDSDMSQGLFLDVGKRMKDIFSDIFYNPKISETIDSFEKIKIFLAFDNLVPIGLKGVDLSFKFVENLLALNLLNPAISILEHLISFRLDGEPRNKAIFMVANLYLNSKEYEKIISALDNWDFDNEELAYIKSKAYLGIKNYVKAEQMLEPYKSQKAYYIKAYIYWNSGDAVKMKQLIEPKLQIRDEPRKPLSELEKLSVLYLANAYALLNEKENFLSLYSAFAEMLKEDPKYYESISMLHTVLILDKVEQLDSVQKALSDLISSNVNFASI